MRWKFAVPFAIVAAAAAAFNILFLDAIIKKGVVAGGQAAFGAKVEIARLRTKFSDLSVRVEGIQIANKNDVWKNVAEAKSIRFALRPLPLLSAKINIEEMSVEGLRFGTPRKTSGALPPRKIKKIQKSEKPSVASRLTAAVYEKGKKEIAALPAAASIKEARDSLGKISPDMVKIEELQTPRELENIKSGLAHKYERNKERLENLNISVRLAPVSAAVEEASKLKITNIDEARAAAPALENLRAAGETAQAAFNELQAAKNEIAADFGGEKELLGIIEDIKNADLKRLAEKLKLPALPSGNVSQALFGPVWLERVNTAVGYIGLVRKYMPARKKADKKVVRERAQGRDVEFPGGPTPRPKFLVEKILVSGSFGRTDSPVSFSGTATDLTSDPVLWGRPATVKISGAGGGKSLDAKAVFDHTSEISKDSFEMAYRGIEAKTLGLPDSEYLPSFDNARAAAEFSISFVDDEIRSRLGLKISGVSHRPAADDDVSRLLADLWRGINELSVAARVEGRAGSLGFSVESDIDRILSERIRKIFGEKLAEAQERLKAEVDRLVAQKRAEVMKEYNERRAAAMNEYAAREKEVRDRIDAVRAKADEIRAKIKEREDAERRRLEEEKRKAEEELRRQGGEKLEQLKRDIFK